jgi:hypothetical protein
MSEHDVPGAADAVSVMREQLGPDLEYLAEPLAPAVSSFVDRKVAAALDAAMRPIRTVHNNVQRHVAQQQAHAAEQQTAAVMADFTARHPDWQQHEEAMFDLAQRIEPRNLTEAQYLDLLHTITTKEQFEKEREAAIADGVQQALGGTVSRRAATARAPSFEEAHAAAKRGVRFEDLEPEQEEPSSPATTGRRPSNRAPTLAEAYRAAQRGERWD